MAWQDRLLRAMGWPDATPVVAVSEEIAQRTPREKREFHIARFTRAIEQCQKPERLPELKANLAFWQTIDRAHRARGTL